MAIRKKTSIEVAYERLRGELLSCAIMPEDRLKITAIALRFDVSPPAVREALARLVSDNLVTFEPLKGFRAAPISCEASRDLLAARVEIECACFRLSIEHGDIGWEEAVVRCNEQLVALLGRPQPITDEALRESQSLFVDALVAGCPNQTLLQVRAGLLEQSQRYLSLAWRFAPHRHDVGAEHRALLEAALARNARQGVKAMKSHILLTRQWILVAMSSKAWLNLIPAQPRRVSAAARRRPIARNRVEDAGQAGRVPQHAG